MVKSSKKFSSENSSLDKEIDASDIWGGRFECAPADIMLEINASIDIDRRLFAQDIFASKAHAEMLAQTSIISREDRDAIISGLDKIFEEIIYTKEYSFEALVGNIGGYIGKSAFLTFYTV